MFQYIRQWTVNPWRVYLNFLEDYKCIIKTIISISFFLYLYLPSAVALLIPIPKDLVKHIYKVLKGMLVNIQSLYTLISYITKSLTHTWFMKRCSLRPLICLLLHQIPTPLAWYRFQDDHTLEKQIASVG